MKFFRIRNWEKYQHYKHRNPPWIKIHFELLSSQDWVNANESTRNLMIVCILIASRNDGNLAADEHYLKRVSHMRKLPNFKPLIESGFLEILQADASTLRTNATPEAEAYSKKDLSTTPLPPSVPKLNGSEKRVLKNDLGSAAACCCALLKRRSLSSLDLSILQGWCRTYDFENDIKPMLIEKSSLFASKNHGISPATLSYFTEAIREKLSAKIYA